MHKNDSRSLLIRLCLSVVGTSIIALGIVFFRLSSLGIDPATAADIGISDTFHWYLGNYQLIFNVILFLTICIFDRSQFGIGTLINMSLPGYIVGYLTPILSQLIFHVLSKNSIPDITILLVCGMAIFSLGISLYTSVNLGVSPYDAVALLFEKKGWFSYRITRSIQDLVFFTLALVFGGPLGIGTFIIAFTTGYFVQSWRFFFKNIFVKYD
ncbi:YczE/YyaS/YitT family protein [Leuconostoc falkenbergense]|uniref:YczE/YyaS/YitT family protein n=1 Tax=Leuconostoc falkenbergense TaxID=2766470 RepID=UPI0039E7CF72